MFVCGVHFFVSWGPRPSGHEEEGGTQGQRRTGNTLNYHVNEVEGSVCVCVGGLTHH